MRTQLPPLSADPESRRSREQLSSGWSSAIVRPLAKVKTARRTLTRAYKTRRSGLRDNVLSLALEFYLALISEVECVRSSRRDRGFNDGAVKELCILACSGSPRVICTLYYSFREGKTNKPQAARLVYQLLPFWNIFVFVGSPNHNNQVEPTLDEKDNSLFNIHAVVGVVDALSGYEALYMYCNERKLETDTWLFFLPVESVEEKKTARQEVAFEDLIFEAIADRFFYQEPNNGHAL